MSDRTPAERSMDDLNARRRQLLTSPALTHAQREELRDVERRLRSARRNVHQMRDGAR
jgi:hypothetical protein